MSREGNAEACPVTKETWEERAKIKQGDCGGQSVYHCLSDSKGWKWERCVEKTKIIKGQCPIFTADGYIDWQPCNTTIPLCPNRTYVSNEVYKFPACFGENIPRAKKAVGNPSAVLIASTFVAMAVAATCILAVVLFIFKRRRTRRHKNRKNMDETETERLYKDEEDRNVSNGVEVLSRTDGKSLFVHGKFGNSVSSTSHLILEKFIENNVEWKSLECLYTDIPENVEENTIMFVYGWFGIWNDDLCSVDKVKKACKELHDILCKETNVRIVIGMRTEYHRKYHTHGCFTPSDLFSNELSLDAVNNEKDKEHIKYFMKKIKKPCKKSECYCHDLKFDNFRDDRDKRIGIPLKMNVLARYHDIINDYVVKRSLLKAMTNHITTLRRDEKTVVIYQWIMYICLKGQYKRSEELDEELIKTMEFEISGLSFNENEENLMKYLKFRNSDKQKMVLPESAQYVFWHPFIYICAFHSLFTTNPDIAMNYCNIDAILQLVRPENYLDTYLEVHADDAMIDLFNQRIQSEGLQDVCKDHPLIIPSADKGENIEDVEQSSEGTPSEHGSFTIISQKAVDMMNM